MMAASISYKYTLSTLHSVVTFAPSITCGDPLRMVRFVRISNFNFSISVEKPAFKSR